MEGVSKIVAVVISIIIFVVLIPVVSIFVNQQNRTVNTDDLLDSLDYYGYELEDVEFDLWDNIIDNPYYMRLIVNDDGDYLETLYLDARVYLNYENLDTFLVDRYDLENTLGIYGGIYLYKGEESQPMSTFTQGASTFGDFIGSIDTFVPPPDTTTKTELLLIIILP